MPDLRSEIKSAIERGWSLTPLNGKRPFLDNWQKRPPASIDECLKWIDAGRNIGVRCGSLSEIVVIDDDSGERSGLTFPPTVTAITGGDADGKPKAHYYYKLPAGKLYGNRSKHLPERIDVRGDGGQVVLPGSIHPDTKRKYRWMEGRSPEEIEIALFPAEFTPEGVSKKLKSEGLSNREIAERVGVSESMVRKYLKNNQCAPLKTSAHPDAHPKRSSAQTNGAHPSCAPASRKYEENYVAKAMKLEVEAITSATEGTRNTTLNTSSFNLGQLIGAGYAERSVVEAELSAAARGIGLTEAEIIKTMRSGIESGIKSPRKIPEPPPSPPSQHRPNQVATSRQPRYIAIPGAHIDDNGEYFEISEDKFTDTCIGRLPSDIVYRKDMYPGELIGDNGALRFVPLTAQRTRKIVSQHMKFGRWKEIKSGPHKGEPIMEFQTCGTDRAGMIFSGLHLDSRVRDLKLLVTYPVYTQDWQISSAGWNDSGIYYDQPDELRKITPIEDLDVVRDTLEDIVTDFPFKDAASRENFFGLLLTPLIRPALQGNSPLHLVMASLPRTGKSLLVEQVFGGAILGDEVPAMTLPRNEDERDKRILSLLMAGGTVWNLDNLNDFVDSASIASLLTAKTYQGRVLGESKMLQLPNNITLTATGNNVKATPEIVKRTIPIVLQPTSSNPEERDDFTHADIARYVRENRVLILSCLLGMVELWLKNGRPSPERSPLGGFNAWSKAVGGILECCGWTDWRANERAWRKDADPETEDLETLVDAWFFQHADSPVQIATICTLADNSGTFSHLLARSTEKGKQTAMGRFIGSKIDVPVKEYIIRRKSSGSSSLYCLEKSELFGGEA